MIEKHIIESWPDKDLSKAVLEYYDLFGRYTKLGIQQCLDEMQQVKDSLGGRKFENFYEKAHIEITVNVSLFYTNDQTNIFCKSNWSAKIKIFDKEGEDLKVRDIRLLQRSGKIEYSQKPFK